MAKGNTSEETMVVAHQIGRDHAKLTHIAMQRSAKLYFKTQEERESFLAGYIGELRRLAAKGESK